MQNSTKWKKRTSSIFRH